MKKILRDDFIQKSGAILGEILETIEKQPVLDIKEIEPEKTVLVIVDMINGFAREGALKSPRVEEMIPEICRISKLCDKYKIKRSLLQTTTRINRGIHHIRSLPCGNC